ncbi:MAG: hypothetical protein EAY75_09810 [Bacteroidetes bacterium]|nr:MAG: hypothetical protein EAY75_09810 [Bacteroidota bacterium]
MTTGDFVHKRRNHFYQPQPDGDALSIFYDVKPDSEIIRQHKTTHKNHKLAQQGIALNLAVFWKNRKVFF